MNLLFFVFCFLNLYGPLTTNLTFAFNVLLFLFVYSNRLRFAYERPYIILSILLLLLSIVAFANTRDSFKDYSVIGTYLRMLVCCTTFPAIIAFFFRKKTKILQILSLTLFLHCLMVLIQMIVPSLQDINTVLFRFQRDAEFLQDFTMRRLGLTGGYDASGLYAAISVVVSIEIFIMTGNKKYGVISAISLISSFFTSRTGMATAFISLFLCVLLNKRSKYVFSGFSFIFITISAISIFYIILPLILNSLGLSTNTGVVETGSNYSSGTKDYLFDYQLLVLEELNTRELIWGYGCGVRNLSWTFFSSDIGYVKQIFQVGIVGVALIVYFCTLMVIKTYRRNKTIKYNSERKMGTQILGLLLIIYLVFNYKNHLMYNVCSFELFLFLYYYLYCLFSSTKTVACCNDKRYCRELRKI